MSQATTLSLRVYSVPCLCCSAFRCKDYDIIVYFTTCCAEGEARVRVRFAAEHSHDGQIVAEVTSPANENVIIVGSTNHFSLGMYIKRVHVESLDAVSWNVTEIQVFGECLFCGILKHVMFCYTVLGNSIKRFWSRIR